MHPLHAHSVSLQPSNLTDQAPQLPAQGLPQPLTPAWLPVLYLGVSLSLGLVTLFVEQQVVNAEPQPVASWQALLKPQPVAPVAPALRIALAKESLARSNTSTDADVVQETAALGTHIARALVADELSSVALKLHLMQEVGTHLNTHRVLALTPSSRR